MNSIMVKLITPSTRNNPLENDQIINQNVRLHPPIGYHYQLLLPLLQKIPSNITKTWNLFLGNQWGK